MTILYSKKNPMSIDLIGKKFGKLTVISKYTEKRKNRYYTICICLCECGKETKVIYSNLRNNSTKSCGCLKKEASKMTCSEKIITCDICGKEFKHSSISIKKTCSKECLKKKHKTYIKKRRVSEFDISLRFILYGIKSRSKKEGYETNIDFKYLKELFNNQNGKCKRTGVNFDLTIYCDNKLKRSPNSMSIDRIDNTKGYVKENIQLVCLMYNLCKNHWSEEEVLAFCKRVVNNE